MPLRYYLIPWLYTFADGWTFVWFGLALSYFDNRYEKNGDRTKPFTLAWLTSAETILNFGWYI